MAGVVQQRSAAGCNDGGTAGRVPGGLQGTAKGRALCHSRVHAHKTGTSETAKLVLSHDTLKMLRVWEVRDKVAEESPLLFPDYKGAEISHLTRLVKRYADTNHLIVVKPHTFWSTVELKTKHLPAIVQEAVTRTVRPVAYASPSLQAYEKNYGVTELEGLGVVRAVKHFRPYLYGHKCEVYTDHEELRLLLNTPQPSGKLAGWGMAIQELDISIHHWSGHHNGNADALSRFPLETREEDLVEVVEGVVATESNSDLATLQRQG